MTADVPQMFSAFYFDNTAFHFLVGEGHRRWFVMTCIILICGRIVVVAYVKDIL